MLKFIFDRKLNLFDCVCISAIGTAASINAWWFLALLPAMAFSNFMEQRCDKP